MSKHKRADLFDLATAAVADDAPLQTKEKSDSATKAKLIKAMPTEFFDAHGKLKTKCKTAMDFSAYIIEAVREKLKRDGAI